MNVQQKTIQVGGKDLLLETGRYGERASAVVTAQYGETMVLASVVMGRAKPEMGYFPLFVEYQEKLYAGGKIKGSRWVKRPGRPSDDAILKARLIDRSIRPLFPKGFINEVQVIVTVLSADGENDADIPAMYAVSTALAISEIPWEGPVSGLRIGMDPQTEEFLLNPTFTEREETNEYLDLVISGSKEATVMLEAGANEVSEAKMLEAFQVAQNENARIATEIGSWAEEVGKDKVDYESYAVTDEIIEKVKQELSQQDINNMVTAIANLEDSGEDDVVDAISEKYEDTPRSDIKDAVSYLIKQEARRQTLEEGKRPDGRSMDEIRELTAEVGLLPRTHGSGMFKRGSTQALTIVTLGSPSLNQLIENMEGELEKRYIHHYNMPPFTVGETGRVGWPSRREVGHGALAERALLPMIPSEEEFPYTIHVVSELMSSNGSTSMASVCGSTLSLMDAGVPIKKPIAGIAMGLLTDGERYQVLTDIQGFEDHTGDMDFKVAGSKDGITAIQMDIKVKGIPFEVLEQALEQARVGRLEILGVMTDTISEPRETLSEFAPKIETITVPEDRIGEIIGPGGKIIKQIIADTGAEVDINDDGSVFITSTDQEAINEAKTTIQNIIRDFEVGEEFDGEVVRITDFGAFVQLAPGRDGLVHVSNMSTDYVKDPHDVVSVGDEVHVRIREIDDLNRINLTMLTKEEENQGRSSSGGGGGNRGGGNDRNRRGGKRDDRNKKRKNFDSRPRR